MAGETYYFFFSIILVLGVTWFIVNLIYLRAKGRAVFGPTYKSGTPERERLEKFASTRNLIISFLFAFVLAANLIYDVNRIMHLSNRDYAHGVLIYAPIASILFFILMIFMTRDQFSKYQSGERD